MSNAVTVESCPILLIHLIQINLRSIEFPDALQNYHWNVVNK